MSVFSYSNVRALQDAYKAESPQSVLAQVDTPTFAKLMQLTDTQGNDFTSAASPSWLKSASYNVDEALQHAGFSPVAGDAMATLGRGVDSLRGSNDQKYEDLSRSLGEGMPRMFAQTGLTLAGFAAGGLPGVAMVGAGAGDAFAKGYTDTNSVGAGLLQGGLMAAAPLIGGVSAKLGTSALAKAAPALAKSPVANFIAAEAGQNLTFGGIIAAQQMHAGVNPLSGEAIFENLAGQIPFLPITVAHGVKAARTKATMPKEVPGEALAETLGNSSDPTESLIAISGTRRNAPPSFTAQNDQGRLMDYLTGATNDSQIRGMLEQGQLSQALEATGLLEPDLSTPGTTFARRARGKRLFETLTPENINTEEGQKFLQRASALLQHPTTELTELVKVAAAVNQFSAKFGEQPVAGLLQDTLQPAKTGGVVEDFLINDYRDTLSPKFEDIATRRSKAAAAERAKLGLPAETTGDTPASPQELALQQQTGIVNEPLKGIRPRAVKGKVKEKTLQERFNEEQIDASTQNPATPKKSSLEAWADAKIAEGKTRMNSGLDPELLSAYVVKGAYHIARGLRDFASWSAEMIRKFGENIKPHLDQIYRESSKLNEGTYGSAKPIRPYKVHPAYDALPSRMRVLLDHFDVGVKEVSNSDWDALEARKAEFGMNLPADGHAVLNQNRIDLRAESRFGNQDIIPHELGHLIDHKFGVLEQFAEADQTTLQELLDLGMGEMGGKRTILDTDGVLAWRAGAKSANRNGIVGEAIGEALGRWLNDPVAVENRYPTLAKKFQELIGPHLPAQDRMNRPARSALQISGMNSHVANSNIFRFVKGTIAHNGQEFTVLGNTNVPKSGLVNENRFQSATQMPKQVFDLVKQVYPEAWDGTNVNVNKLMELEKSRPMFETHVYGQEGSSAAKMELDQLTHEWVDNMPQGERNILNDYVYAMDEGNALNLENNPQRLKDLLVQRGHDPAKIDRWVRLKAKVAGEPDARGPRATSYYNTISPFDTKKYPVVRIDVTVPNASKKLTTKELANKYGIDEDLASRGYAESAPLWRQDDIHENLPNTLGWAMVQFVPDPRTGETVMFVAEQQSRWGQDRARAEKNTQWKIEPDGPRWKLVNSQGKVVEAGFASKSEAEARIRRSRDSVAPHPFLALQHKLVFKAAMDEARRRKVTKMVVSDSPSAGMTQRHDMVENLPRQAVEIPVRRFLDVIQTDPDYSVNVKDQQLSVTSDGLTIAKFKVSNGTVSIGGSERLPRALEALFPEIAAGRAEPPQAEGMRQHYDKLLQSAAEKMTGSKGVPVDMGVHKNAPKKETTLRTSTPEEVQLSDDFVNGRIPPNEYYRRRDELLSQNPAEVVTQEAGSPVFRNPDGTPKTNVTGMMYDISPDVISGVRYNRADQFAPDGLLDASGKVTSSTMRDTYDRLLKLEGDPDRAMIRLDQMMRGELSNRIKSTAPDVFPLDGLAAASRTFDALGIDQPLKEKYLNATHSVLSKLDTLEGSSFRNFQDFVKAGIIPPDNSASYYGVFYPATREIGVNTENMRFSSPEVAAFQTAVTYIHESIHNVVLKADLQDYNGIDSFRSRAVNNAREFLSGIDKVQRYELLRDKVQAILKRNVLKHDDLTLANLHRSIETSALTPEETMVDYAALSALEATLKGGADKVINDMRWMPEPMRAFVQTVVRTIQELRQMVGKTLDFLGGVKRVDLTEFDKNIAAILSPDKVVEQAKQTIVDAAQPSRVLFENPAQVGIQYKQTGVKAVDERNVELAKSGGLERSLGVMLQTANSLKWKNAIPEASQVMHALTTLGGRIRSTMNTIRGDFMVRVDGQALQELAAVSNSKLSPEQIMKKSNMQRVADSEKLQHKLSDIYRVINDLTASNAPMPGWDSPEVQAHLRDMSPEDVGAMKAVYEGQLGANRIAADLVIAKTANRFKYDIYDIYHGAGLSHADARKAGNTIMDYLLRGNPLPPELLAIRGTENAARYWEKVQPTYQDVVAVLNRPYFSELRTGRWQVVYDRGEGVAEEVRTGRAPANNIEEKNALVKQLESQGYTIKEIKDTTQQQFSEFDAVPTYVAERLVKLEQARYDAAVDRLDPAAADELRSIYSFGEALKEEIDARKQFLAKRRLAPGREYINMVNNQAAYAEVVAASVAKSLARDEVAWLMKSKNWDKDRAFRAEVEEFAHNIFTVRQQSDIVKNVKRAVIGTAMGANISTAVVDASQGLTVALWKVAETVGVPKAASYIKDGYKIAFGFGKTDPEFDKILWRAHDDAYLQTGYALNEVVDLNDVTGYNVVRAGDRRNMVNLEGALTSHEYMAGRVFDLVKQAGGKLFQGIMIPNKLSAQVNNKVSLYAGYKVGKELGYTGDKLYDYAVQTMQITNFQGGRAAQSTFKTKAGHFNSLVETATLLTNYPLSVMSQMYGNYKSMLASSGLSPAARKRAGEVFAGQLLTQFALAGTLGMGLDVASKIIADKFGIDVEAETRQALAAIDESGTLADVMLHGVMNQITGVDVASRFSLSGIGGFNGYTGFDAKGLFGPAGGLFQAITEAPSQVYAGKWDQLGVLPNGLRKMIHAISGEPVKDKSGQVLLEPTTAQRFTEFVGFRPNEVSRIQNQRALYRSAEQIADRESKALQDERIGKLLQGKYEEVLIDIKKELATDIDTWLAEGLNPSEISQIKEKVLRQRVVGLVDAAVKRTLPIDPLSSGDRNSGPRRQAIAQSFGTRLAPRAVLAQRENMRAQMLQGLGQASVKRTPRAIQLSRLITQITTENPAIPLSEARIIAESQLAQ